MLTEYIQAAIRHACYTSYDDSTSFGSIDLPGFEGVWANEATREKAERALQSVLEDWLLLGLQLRHRLPVADGIGVNALVAA